MTAPMKLAPLAIAEAAAASRATWRPRLPAASRPETVKLSSRSARARSARSCPYSVTNTVNTEEMSATAATRRARLMV